MTDTGEWIPFPFIVGSGRSGNTLLRAMLDAHPEMAVADETHFIAQLARRHRRYSSDGPQRRRLVSDLLATPAVQELGLRRGDVERELEERPSVDVATAIRVVMGLYARRRGKTRYGNKTPIHVLSLPSLASVLPEARFIHVVRDGRAVALSFLDANFGSDTLWEAALRWRRMVLVGRSRGRRLGPRRYLEIRYEDLVSQPEATLHRVCTFIDLPFDETMLRYFEVQNERSLPVEHRNLTLPPRNDLRNWRREMRPSELESFEVLAGDALRAFGYELAAHAPVTRRRMAIETFRLRYLASRMKRRFVDALPSISIRGDMNGNVP